MTESMKCVVIGDAEVGKTCLLNSYLHQTFDFAYTPTTSESYEVPLKKQDNPCVLELVDTSGREKYDELRQQHYLETDAVLVCFSVVSPESFKNVKERWLPEIESHCEGTPFILVGTKVDQRENAFISQKLADNNDAPVTAEQGRELADSVNAFDYVECSALTQTNLNTGFKEALYTLLDLEDEKELRRVKCVTVGDGEVGKTCMLTSYTQDTFSSTYTPTIFDDYKTTVVIQEETCILVLTDTAGDKTFDRMRPLSYAETDIFLVCFSVVSPSSFRNVTQRWVPEIKQYGKGAPFILIGTMTDLRDDRATVQKLALKNESRITTSQGRELAESLKASAYVECSALTQEGLKSELEKAIVTVMSSIEVDEQDKTQVCDDVSADAV